MAAKQWVVDIYISADDDMTYADSHLRAGDQTPVVGRGKAHRRFREHLVPEVSQEFAVARSLSALANHVFQAALDDAERITHPAHRQR